jgi:hypothetical protein
MRTVLNYVAAPLLGASARLSYSRSHGIDETMASLLTIKLVLANPSP